MTKRSKATRPFPIANLKYLHDSGKLWLNPEYQREAVWTRSQKQLLIDSLLKDMDIPKLYFREIDKNGFEYEVVDGQQRLRAIFDYLNNGFRLSRSADQVDGNPVADLPFSTLPTDLQMRLQNVPLDVVVMNAAYSDDDIEEIFLRYQNGTPLNAPEKRRAIAGSMRTVVEALAAHKVFALCGFKDTRFAFEDAAAKILHLLMFGAITDIRAESLRRTYEANASITEDHKDVKRLKRAFSFIQKAFKDRPSPRLKKYAIISLTYLVAEMLDEYDLSKHPSGLSDAYLSFDLRRIENEELPEENQNSALAAYTNAARSDSIQDMRYRHETLRSAIVEAIPDLRLLDPTRSFSEDQRMAIYRRGKGICKSCGTVCEQSAFHADHITPHSKGGQTTIANGQLLCPSCNAKKGDRES